MNRDGDNNRNWIKRLIGNPWQFNYRGLYIRIKSRKRLNILKSVYLIATRDLSNLWLQFFLSQNQGFMRLFEKTVLK